MFFNHSDCKNRIHELKQIKAEREKKIHSLEFEIQQLVTQIQELKAINHYQTWVLENRITELEEQYRLCKVEVGILDGDEKKEQQ